MCRARRKTTKRRKKKSSNFHFLLDNLSLIVYRKHYQKAVEGEARELSYQFFNSTTHTWEIRQCESEGERARKKTGQKSLKIYSLKRSVCGVLMCGKWKVIAEPREMFNFSPLKYTCYRTVFSLPTPPLNQNPANRTFQRRSISYPYVLSVLCRVWKVLSIHHNAPSSLSVLFDSHALYMRTSRARCKKKNIT